MKIYLLLMLVSVFVGISYLPHPQRSEAAARCRADPVPA